MPMTPVHSSLPELHDDLRLQTLMPTCQRLKMHSMPLALALVVLCVLRASEAQDTNRPLGPFSEIEQIVHRHFAVKPDYHRGDLITRNDTSTLLAQLKLYGWMVDDGAQLRRLVLSDKDYLSIQFRHPKNKKLELHLSAILNGLAESQG